jgi:hypothetical protein
MGREERPVTPVSIRSKSGGLSDDQYAAIVEARLIGKERVLAALNLRKGMLESGGVTPDSLVLTESQVVYVSVNSHVRSTATVSVRDVTVAKVESERHGPSAYFWGVLAVILGFLISQSVENQVGSIVAGVAVAAAGVYLIADKIFRPINSVVLFLADSPSGESRKLRCDLRGGRANSDVYDFISLVHTRKEELLAGDRNGRAPVTSLRRSRYAYKVTQSGGGARRFPDRE